MFKKLLLGLIVALGVSPAFAQTGSYPNNSVLLGRGPGVQGFKSIGPGASGYCLVAKGPSSTPVFEACPGGSGGVTIPTLVTTSPYTVLQTDTTILVNRPSAATTINLQSAATRGTLNLKIIDVGGNASVNNISIVPNGGDILGGIYTSGSPLKITTDFGGWGILPIGTAWAFDPSNTSGSSNIFTLTTTGSSGPSTYINGVLNIPQYSGGGGGTPGGSNTQCQYNNAGSFGGITGCTSNGTTVTLTAPVIGSIVNTGTLSLPTLTDTLVGRVTEDMLFNKSYVNPYLLGSVTGPDGYSFWDVSGIRLTPSQSIFSKTFKAWAGSDFLTVAFGSSGTVTAPRALDFIVNDADRSITLGGNISLAGNLTTAGSFVTSGAFGVTQTYTGTTNVTFPTSGTLLTSASPSITSPTISGGTINNAVIGGTTPAAATFTTLNANGGVTFSGLPGSGTIASSICATAGGALIAQAGANCYGGGSASAGGNNTNIQYNSSAVIAGSDAFVFNGTDTVSIGIAGSVVGKLAYRNATSGSVTLQAVTGALGSAVLSLPAATDTLVGKATTDTFTNKTFNTAGTGNSFLINGVAVTNNTGTGAIVRENSPVLVTPSLGVAAATSINGNTFTTGTYTLTGASSKTLTFNNSITLAGTDSTIWTGPSSNATLAALNIASQTVTGGANVTSQSISTGSYTIDCGTRPLQYITNGGAFTLTAPANDGNCILLVTNNGSAGAITFSGFSVGSSTGDALTTTNTSKFSIMVWRVNGTSGYRVAAHQ